MCVWCKGGKGGRGCVTRWLHLHMHMRTHNGTKHLHAQVSFTCERPSMAERRNLLNFDEETPDKSCYVTWDDFVKEQECLILVTLLQYRPKVINKFTYCHYSRKAGLTVFISDATNGVRKTVLKLLYVLKDFFNSFFPRWISQIHILSDFNLLQIYISTAVYMSQQNTRNCTTEMVK